MIDTYVSGLHLATSSYHILLFKLQNISVWSTYKLKNRSDDVGKRCITGNYELFPFSNLVFITWRFKITAAKYTKSSNLNQGSKFLRIPVNFRNKTNFQCKCKMKNIFRVGTCLWFQKRQSFLYIIKPTTANAMVENQASWNIWSGKTFFGNFFVVVWTIIKN